MAVADQMNRGMESPAPTVRELAMVLFRQRRLFLGIAGPLLIFTLLFAIFGSSYRAQLRILVRRGRSDPPVSSQQNAAPDFSRVEVTEEELNSEVELLKDDDVLRRVAEANDLASHDWLRWIRPHEEPAALVERATKRLADRIKVESVKKTNVIAVNYEASDPQLAARVLQSLSNVYLEKHMEVHRPEGQLRFFDQQAEESLRQLNQTQQKLLEFTRSHNMVAGDLQRDLLLQRLDSVATNYGQTQLEMAETEHRVQELRKDIAELPQRTTTQFRTSDNPELLRSLKASLLDLQLKKTQLLTKYEPSHRLVQEVNEQIAQAESAIAAEKSMPIRDETTDKNPDYEWAKSEVQKARVDLKGLEARQKTANAQLATYSDLARQMGENAIIQNDLMSREKAAQENYLLYVKKREEARMGDALDQGGIVNVAIAEEPTVPALPVWPAAAVAFIGFVTSITVGAGAAFTADHLDPALRTPDEVLTCLDIPVLASLPAKREKRLSA
jgi:polysaccharide biosynthesis protein PslE